MACIGHLGKPPQCQPLPFSVYTATGRLANGRLKSDTRTAILSQWRNAWAVSAMLGELEQFLLLPIKRLSAPFA